MPSRRGPDAAPPPGAAAGEGPMAKQGVRWTFLIEHDPKSSGFIICSGFRVYRWRNPQKVVWMDPYIKDIFGFVPSTLTPLYLNVRYFYHMKT